MQKEGGLGFSDFVGLLRQSEIARAAMTVLDVLEDKGAGRRLQEAVVMRGVTNDPNRGKPTIVVRGGQNLVDFMNQHKKDNPDVQPPFNVAFRKQSNTNMVLNEQITDVSHQHLQDLWDNLTPDDDGNVNIDDLRFGLLSAHAPGDLLITDNDLLDVVMKLTEIGGEDGAVSFEALVNAMAPFMAGYVKPDDLAPNSPMGTLKPTLSVAIQFRHMSTDFIDDENLKASQSAPVAMPMVPISPCLTRRLGSTGSSQFSEDEYEVDEFLASGAGVSDFNGYHVILYTSTTHSDHFQGGAERRLLHLIDIKGLQYEIVFLDLDENRSRRDAMIVRSGTNELPQLHIRGKPIGSYQVVQEMEDSGSLDALLTKEKINFVKKSTLATPRNVKHHSKTDGPLTVHCTSKFALVRWDPRAAKLNLRKKFEWMLLMNEDPIYVGPQTS